MRTTSCLSRIAVCAPLVAVGALLLVLAVALGGCPHKSENGPQIMAPIPDDFDKPLLPGALALRKLDPKDYPDFTEGFEDARRDPVGLKQAIANSLDYLTKLDYRTKQPSSMKYFPYGEVTHDQAVATLQDFLKLLDSGLTASQMSDAVRARYDVYMSVGCDNKGKVLFTGYYTPILDGSLTRTDKFRYPLYRIPAGLSKNDDGVVAAPDRQTIEQTNPFAGSELVWLGDPFEVYVAHVQGSAKIRLPGNPALMTVGYTANNGKEYVSVRSELAKDGKIGKHDGLAAMMRYFKAHPEDVSKYTSKNPRFIFFTDVEDGRPRGCLNEPVTTIRSIATDKPRHKQDKDIYPRACMAFLAAKMPAKDGKDGEADYRGFALDQDTGGAIRAAGRCDLYLGVGDKAGELAGRTMNEGKLYYVFLKPSAVPPPVLQPSTPPASSAPPTPPAKAP